MCGVCVCCCLFHPIICCAVDPRGVGMFTLCISGARTPASARPQLHLHPPPTHPSPAHFAPNIALAGCRGGEAKSQRAGKAKEKWGKKGRKRGYGGGAEPTLFMIAAALDKMVWTESDEEGGQDKDRRRGGRGGKNGGRRREQRSVKRRPVPFIIHMSAS